MRRPLAFGLGLVLIAGGCRAIVGIDDLEPPPPPRDGGGGKGDSGGSSSGGPGPTAGQDSGLVAKCSQDSQCPKCCKDNDPQFRSTFEGTNAGGQCLCRPELGCPERCMVVGKQCAQPAPGGGGGQPDDCLRCTDELLMTQTAPCIEDACKGDPACLEGLACFRACKP